MKERRHSTRKPITEEESINEEENNKNNEKLKCIWFLKHQQSQLILRLS